MMMMIIIVDKNKKMIGKAFVWSCEGKYDKGMF